MRWNSMNRVAMVAVIAAAAAATTVRAEEPARRPNILMIVADDLGWTDLSEGATSYGNGSKYHRTPTIDSLARDGMSFSSAYTCPNCAPSRAALMTGQYAVHNGVYNVGSLNRGSGRLVPATQSNHIRPEAVTVAETLRAGGYHTAHVGKFHVSSHEEVTAVDGFDVNYGGGKKGDGGPHGYFAIKAEGAAGGWTFQSMGPEMDAFAGPYTKEYVEQVLAPVADGNDPMTLVGKPKHLTDAQADAAVAFLKGYLVTADGRRPEKPFYLNLAFNAVHTAVRARPDLLAKWRGIESTDPRHTRADYAALLAGEDEAVRRVLKVLDDPNGDGDTSDSVVKETVVVFWSDNGGFVGSTRNTPLREAKGTFYEGGIRVPLIVRWPGHVEAGAVNDSMVSGVDFYPTFAELGGAALPDPAMHVLDGVSFAPVLLGKVKDLGRGPIFYHFPGYLDSRAYPCSEAIETVGGKRYKLLYSYEDQHYELYDLSDDLSEKTDLLRDGKATPGDEKVAEGVRGDLVKWLSETKPAWVTDRKTKEPVPMPVEVAAALAGGNKVTREGHAMAGRGDED